MPCQYDPPGFLGAVVEKVYSAILWLSLYLVDTAIGCPNSCPTFEQQGPNKIQIAIS